MLHAPKVLKKTSSKMHYMVVLSKEVQIFNAL